MRYAVECENVWKKFMRGERNDSLRDAIPALWKYLRRRARSGLSDREFWALGDVSFRLEKGEALGIIGPNGAGKSTLLKILSSILVPDQGGIQIHGRLSALIEVGAGFHHDLTGRENIYLNGAILGMTRREIHAKLDEIIDFAGVGDFIDTPVKRYSSGMQARLGFSVAAHMDPDILLVDEVLAVGDAQFQQRCLDKMHYFANSGRSIIFISHNLQAVSELCPRCILLRSGRKEFDGPTSQAIQSYLSHMRDSTHVPMRGATSIHRVRLLNEHHQPSHEFHAGDQARLSFDVALERPASQYLLGLAIKRVTDGQVLCDYNLTMPQLLHSGKSNTVTLEFEMNFLKGSYAVVLFLADKDTYAKPVYLDYVKVFEVTESQAYAGIVHINPRAACLTSAGCTPAGDLD